jgi:2-dehydropantoate 2-reductase
MKFAMIGAGGVGGYFGARLIQAGHDVTFIARGRTLEALRTNGLKVESINGDVQLPKVQATDDAKTVGPVDVAFVAVKTWQFKDVQHHLPPLMGNESAAVSLMNGVDGYDELSKVVGPEHVMGGLCAISAFVVSPGHIKHVGVVPMVAIGEWDNHKTRRLERLAEALKGAGVETRTPENIQVAIWNKFMFIASVGGVGGVTRVPVGVIRTVPESRSLLKRAMEEIAALARAFDVPVGQKEFEEAWGFVEGVPPHTTASMQRDVMDGKPSELREMSGAVVRLGLERKVHVPVHQFVYESLLPQEMKARSEIAWPQTNAK